ncbi:MAG: anhydro-N-acetylmuramic acid kinase [Gemmatimonadetes bacterium]|nr:anhydro-N-acetylmuramic acid kinase [Gemmatimonadota bacterium]
MSELGVGLMSGTSLDGVSAALVRIRGRSSVELLRFRTNPYSADERAAIGRAIREGNPRDLALINVILGELLARATLDLLAETKTAPQDLSFIASHGQTIWHEPPRATLQLGDPAVIAERTGVRVVSDFRSRDVAAGGQGAPLVPVADALLFGRDEGPRALLNIGGIANVSWVPRRGDTDGVIAFDTGPGVAVIDAVARLVDPTVRFDAGGARAARGKPEEKLVDEILQDPFFTQQPPKSTGRELFGDQLAARLREAVRNPDDCLATAVRLTVRSVAEQLTKWLPQNRDGGQTDLLISGGGARNQTLVAGLKAALPAWPIRHFSEVFFDGDAKEAVAFALLGWLALRGRPGNVPSATGARGFRILGRITPA